MNPTFSSSSLEWPQELQAALNAQPSQLIATFGKLVADEVHHIGQKIVLGGHVPAPRTLMAGGAPANITSLLADSGRPSRMTGWVGTDPMAQGLAGVMAKRGVDLRCKFSGTSPKATVLVDEKGERALLTDDGVGGLEPGDVQAEWFADAAVVHLDGYDLFEERFPDAVKAAADVAHSLGKVVTIDMGAANRIEDFGVDAYLEVLQSLRPHVLFSNVDEAKVLRLNAQRLAWLPLLITHRGRLSTLVSTTDQRREYAVPKLKIKDSTGCGDAFAAGFLAGMVEGRDLAQSVAQAHEWAQKIAVILGAQMPFEAEPVGV